MAPRAMQVSAQARIVRLPQGKASAGMMVVHKISGKGSKISTSTHQQRAVIFVNRKPQASGIKVAEKKAPTARVQTRLAEKNVTARSKLADRSALQKSASQRIHVALAGRR
jgi:hypothetical protein